MNRPNYLLFKKCTKCGKILHISRFYKDKRSKYGVRSICKECAYKQTKTYRENNREQYREYGRSYYHKDIEKSRERNRQNYHKDIEKSREKSRQNYYNNVEKNKERSKNYYHEHRDECRLKNKEWKKNNPEWVINNHHKRREQLENQGNGITKEQWLEMMNFFDWKCAYSGEYIGGDNKDKIRTIDHIVALDNGGEHEIWNLVPMYANYNYSKHTKDMLEWYLEQPFFSIERLTKIYEWRIYAYWKWKDEI